MCNYCMKSKKNDKYFYSYRFERNITHWDMNQNKSGAQILWASKFFSLKASRLKIKCAISSQDTILLTSRFKKVHRRYAQRVKRLCVHMCTLVHMHTHTIKIMSVPIKFSENHYQRIWQEKRPPQRGKVRALPTLP